MSRSDQIGPDRHRNRFAPPLNAPCARLGPNKVLLPEVFTRHAMLSLS